MIRVLLVEDHPIFRAGLTSGLSAADDIEVCGEAADVDTAVAVAQDQRPDVVLMDLDLGEGSGIDATSQIVQILPDVAVLILTMHENEASVFAAVCAGARGYLLKGVDQDALFRAVRGAAAGETLFGPGIAARVLSRLRQPPNTPQPEQEDGEPLTDREREILELMAQGWGNNAIAQRLFLSPKTVRNNVSRILSKLQAATRGDAIVRARRWGYGNA